MVRHTMLTVEAIIVVLEGGLWNIRLRTITYAGLGGVPVVAYNMLTIQKVVVDYSTLMHDLSKRVGTSSIAPNCEKIGDCIEDMNTEANKSLEFEEPSKFIEPPKMDDCPVVLGPLSPDPVALITDSNHDDDELVLTCLNRGSWLRLLV